MSTVNEVFNIKRFADYTVRTWGLYARRYLLQAGIFAAAILVPTILVCSFSDEFHGSFAGLGTWCLFLVYIFFLTFPVTVMHPLKNRGTLVLENTAPASVTEKWLFVLLNTTLGAAVLFAAGLAVSVLVGAAIVGWEPFGIVRNLGDDYHLRMLPLSLLSIQSLMMFAGTLERRNHKLSFVYIWLLIGVLAILFTVGPIWISEKFPAATQFGPMFVLGNNEVSSATSTVMYSSGFDIDSSTMTALSRWFSVAWITLLWLCSWLNFRERAIK